MANESTGPAPGVANPADQTAPIPADALIIIPVRNTVLFPGVVMPITIGRPKSIAAAQQAVREQRPIGILLQREAELSEPGPDDLYRVGTMANIVRYITGPDESHHLVCQGVQRIRMLDYLPGTPFPVARVLHIPEPTTSSPEIEARFLNLQRQAIEAAELLPQAPQELVAVLQATTSPSTLADLATSYMDIKPQEKQASGRAYRGASPEPRDRTADKGDFRRASAGGDPSRTDGDHPAPARRRRREDPGGRGAERGYRQGQNAA